MQRLLAALLFFAALSACSKVDLNSNVAGFADKQSAPNADLAADGKRRQYLAYAHFIQMEAEENKVVALHETARAACQQDVQNQCVVLESSVASGHMVSASLRVRAKADGIRQIIALLGKQGNLINQRTQAEDLAGPIEDSAKKLAMLTDYRSRLEGLRERASSNIDALIKVNKELADVQGQIEAMSGQRTHLMQRVETETLSVNINSTHGKSFWTPISIALSGFGANFSSAISGTITAVAYVIPYGIAFLAFAWVLVKLWRRMRRPKAGV